MSRLSVQKTLKMYVGGAFIRSESGRVQAITSASGAPMYVCLTSRKDLRNAIAKARAAQPGWAGRTAYNRGQILYRIAEVLEDRRDALHAPASEVDAAIDRMVHYAGWTDKLGSVLSSINAVASGHVNYSRLSALGVVVLTPSAKDGLLGMVDALGSALLQGNSVIVLSDVATAETSVALSEALAVSDVPAGVVALMTGNVADALTWADHHDDVDSIVTYPGALAADRWAQSQHDGARVLRRLRMRHGVDRPATARELGALTELQTVWMSS